jgi:hypothetical protein
MLGETARADPRWDEGFALALGESLVAASTTSADLASSTSDSDFSSRPINEFRAPVFTRISSSSFNWSARVSRFCVFWMTKTIRNVTIVVPVLITSCQVSDQPKNGPVTPHKTMLKKASANVPERPS